MVKPGTKAPDLVCETLKHGTFDAAEAPPPGGTFVAFHRGSHCKWTRMYLKELDDRIGDYALRGVRDKPRRRSRLTPRSRRLATPQPD